MILFFFQGIMDLLDNSAQPVTHMKHQYYFKIAWLFKPTHSVIEIVKSSFFVDYMILQGSKA